MDLVWGYYRACISRCQKCTFKSRMQQNSYLGCIHWITLNWGLSGGKEGWWYYCFPTCELESVSALGFNSRCLLIIKMSRRTFFSWPLPGFYPPAVLISPQMVLFSLAWLKRSNPGTQGSLLCPEKNITWACPCCASLLLLFHGLQSGSTQ